MSLWQRLRKLWAGKELPVHLQRGKLGERAARRHLSRRGLKFLTANFRSKRGEIDLVFRDHDCLVFVELKTRANKRTKQLELSESELDRIYRYRSNPKKGGWQSRLYKIFGRHFPD